MDIGPLLAALRRNPVGAVLVCLQVALTLAIVCNSLFIIQQRGERMKRPTGLDEARIFTFRHNYVDETDDAEGRLRGDLAALRGLPGVTDAMVSNSYPLSGGGWSLSVSPTPLDPANPRRDLPQSAMYFVDEHAAGTLGAQLVEGRWFRADEIGTLPDGVQPRSPVIIVTKALADRLFPDGKALGRTVWFEDSPTTIVGIVARFQTPWASSSFGETFIEHSVLAPFLYVGSGQRFIVRTEPGRQQDAMLAAERTLRAASNARIISDVRPFEESRARRYRGDRALALILGSLSALLLLVTGCGIVGLTSYWIQQRRRQIGVRRALGARRADIVRYFHVENALIAGAGVALGLVLAWGGNLWLATHFEMTRITGGFLVAGAGIVLLLAQAAVTWPALRAASIPPALAVRAV